MTISIMVPPLPLSGDVDLARDQETDRDRPRNWDHPSNSGDQLQASSLQASPSQAIPLQANLLPEHHSLIHFSSATRSSQAISNQTSAPKTSENSVELIQSYQAQTNPDAATVFASTVEQPNELLQKGISNSPSTTSLTEDPTIMSKLPYQKNHQVELLKLQAETEALLQQLHILKQQKSNMVLQPAIAGAS